MALQQGDFERATAILAESLTLRRDIGDRGGMAWCLEKLAEIAHLRRNAARAVRIYGAAAALPAPLNSVIDPVDQPPYQRIIDDLRAELNPDVFEAVWAEGQAMPLDQLIAYAVPQNPP